jgi:hypothetical protein
MYRIAGYLAKGFPEDLASNAPNRPPVSRGGRSDVGDGRGPECPVLLKPVPISGMVAPQTPPYPPQR